MDTLPLPMALLMTLFLTVVVMMYLKVLHNLPSSVCYTISFKSKRSSLWHIWTRGLLPSIMGLWMYKTNHLKFLGQHLTHQIIHWNNPVSLYLLGVSHSVWLTYVLTTTVVLNRFFYHTCSYTAMVPFSVFTTSYWWPGSQGWWKMGQFFDYSQDHGIHFCSHYNYR